MLKSGPTSRRSAHRKIPFQTIRVGEKTAEARPGTPQSGLSAGPIKAIPLSPSNYTSEGSCHGAHEWESSASSVSVCVTERSVALLTTDPPLFRLHSLMLQPYAIAFWETSSLLWLVPFPSPSMTLLEKVPFLWECIVSTV